MPSDIQTRQRPITPTPELATRILCRALRLVDFLQQNARLPEYAHWEYEQYAEFARERGMPIPTEEEVANLDDSCRGRALRARLAGGLWILFLGFRE